MPGRRFADVLLRGDTDFSLTGQFDRWDGEDVRFVFAYDAKANLVAKHYTMNVADSAEILRFVADGNLRVDDAAGRGVHQPAQPVTRTSPPAAPRSPGRCRGGR